MKFYKNDITDKQWDEINEVYRKGGDGSALLKKYRTENHTDEYKAYLEKGEFEGDGMDADDL